MGTYQDGIAAMLGRSRRTLADNPTVGGGQSQIQVGQRPVVALPSGGQSFMQHNVAAVVMPAIGATVTVVTYTVPLGRYGFITRIANQFVGGGWTEGTGDLLWRLNADGIPIEGYDSLIASIGTMSGPANLDKNPIRIYENQIITLDLQNVNVVPAAQPLLGLLRGYIFPLEQESEESWL